MTWSWPIAACLLTFVLLGGCGGAASTARGENPTHVRCLSEPSPGAPSGGERPLFFLFCIQSP